MMNQIEINNKLSIANANVLLKVTTCIQNNIKLDAYLIEEYWNIVRDFIDRIQELTGIEVEVRDNGSDEFTELDCLYTCASLSLALSHLLMKEEYFNNEDKTIINSYIFITTLIKNA